MDFTSPSAPSLTLTVRVQYSGRITAAGSTCASASPQSVPATKPEGSSVYVATFSITPTGVGSCVITVTDKKGRRVLVPVYVGAAGHLYFVAHEDDDILFMNPDIQHAIAAGYYVTTVYLTAGACNAGDNYYLRREAGVMAAYARLAGVADEWTRTDRSIHEMRLMGNRKVTLVFFRLPASKSEAGNVCDDAATNLRGLWSDGASEPALTLMSVDGAKTYSREQLIAALADLIRKFHPVHIGTLDGTGLFGDGTDPSGLQIGYDEQGGACYYYDHSDHYHVGLFAGAARDLFDGTHVFRAYRGYNQAQEAENVGDDDWMLKRAAFAAYGAHDGDVGVELPFKGLYEPWLRRQYDAVATPADFQPLCRVLAIAQQPSSEATSGVPLPQQPVVQLKDLTGANVPLSGVQVSAAISSKAATLSGTTVVATDGNGRAVFTDLALTGESGQYPLYFTALGFTEAASEPVALAAPLAGP
jgi:hypothetical protein